MLALVFVLSGTAGLVFETVLQRELHRTFGASSWATSTVLAAFMGGTALGAWVFGRLVDRSAQPLRTYALLELGVGVCALLTPSGSRLLSRIFVALGHGHEQHDARLVLLRIALAFAFVLPPTLLMGGALPAMARALTGFSRGGDGRWVARLYALNLVGASVGALATGYGLLPWLGLSRALALGGLLNFVAGGLAWSVSRADPTPTPTPAADPGPGGRLRRLVLVAAAWSGFSSFAYEVVWTQLIGLVVGASVYAFALMLAIFLAGLLLGAAWATRVSSRRLGWRLLGWVQFASAMLTLVTVPLWQRIPRAFELLGPHVTGFWGREVVRALACVVVVGFPAVLVGAFYPLLLRQIEEGKGVGRAVGTLSSVNTVGAVVGSLTAGFLLLPALGSRGLLDLLAVLGTLSAALCFRGSPKRQLVALAGAAAVALMPAWNLNQMFSGQNVYFTSQYWSTGTLLHVSENVESGFTSVSEYPSGSGFRVLLTNGKFQGNDSGEVLAQYRFAQLPMLLSHDYHRALLIGVGTASSLAMLAAQPFERVEAVEMSRDIIFAARKYFSRPNAGVLDSGRVQLHYGDGRNHLLLTDHRYDLVTLELTSIWLAGEADLYNQEFYASVRQHLAPRGVVQQWVQLHHMSRRDLASVLASVRSEFPHVALFIGGRQGQILASMEPLEINYREVTGLSERLRGSFATRDMAGGDILTLYGELELDEGGVSRFVADEAGREGRPPGSLVSTDDNLLLEYETPRGNVLPPGSMRDLILGLHRFGPATLPIVEATEAHAAEHIKAARLAGERHMAAAATALKGVEDTRSGPLKALLMQGRAPEPAPTDD